MDWLDYREKLGIGFSDREKTKLFVCKVQNFLYASEDLSFNSVDEYKFCSCIGAVSLVHSESIEATIDLEKPRGFKRAWLYLQWHTEDMTEFLAHLVALLNTYGGVPTNRAYLLDVIEKSLYQCHIEYELLKEDGDYFFFPKGAKELDDALVSEPLEWLKDYPNAHKTYVIALKQYSDGVYIRDTADNLRKALEAFLQEFLGNNKNLETNKNEICKYLGREGVDPGIAGLFQPLINSYKNINDSIVKHNDKIDPKLLEFLLYQTGVLIRMILVVKQAGVSK